MKAITIKVTFEDGNYLITRFNGTMEEAEAYYVGTAFQFGDTEARPYDLMIEAVKVELL